jgi:hypothetical protein
MHCVKIVYINILMIFVMNKYTTEGGGGGKRKGGSGSLCVSVNFFYLASLD